MKRALISTALALATTGATQANVLTTWDFTCAASGAGSFTSLGTVNMKLTLTFDAAASVMDAANAITAWNYTVTRQGSGEVIFSAAGTPTTGQNAAPYTRVTVNGTSTRRYVVALGGQDSGSWQGSAVGTVSPVNLVQIAFVAARSGTGYGTLGESLTQSQGTSYGVLTVAGNTVPGAFGTIAGVGFAVPAPSALALLGTAGFVVARRRRS